MGGGFNDGEMMVNREPSKLESLEAQNLGSLEAWKFGSLGAWKLGSTLGCEALGMRSTLRCKTLGMKSTLGFERLWNNIILEKWFNLRQNSSIKDAKHLPL